jgi:hypothetical protein
MIPRDVGVHVEPDALDVVVVGAIRRKEVQLDAAVQLGEDRLGLLARVD